MGSSSAAKKAWRTRHERRRQRHLAVGMGMKRTKKHKATKRRGSEELWIGPGHPLYEYLKAKGYKVGRRKGKAKKGRKSTSRSAAAKKAWRSRRGG